MAGAQELGGRAGARQRDAGNWGRTAAGAKEFGGGAGLLRGAQQVETKGAGGGEQEVGESGGRGRLTLALWLRVRGDEFF